MEADDRKLFEASLRDVTQATGDGLDAALVELGWQDALAEDPQAAVSLLFDLQGQSNSTSTALDDVIGHALGTVDPAVAVVLPAPSRVDPPGVVVGGEISLHGVCSRRIARSDQVLVVAASGDAQVAVTLPVASVATREVRGLDPELGLVEVTAERVALPNRQDQQRAVAWHDAVAAGRIALAYELLGASRAMLKLARDHAETRVQFGRAIASFQAVRHKLSDSYVAVESSVAVTAVAWEDPSPLAASLAKAVAGRNAKLVARHAQQVMAGMGFTLEHPYHRYLRRTMVLDELLGSSRTLTAELGRELLATRRLPELLPL
jgi:Acyl-CoA dehydrogenase, C-terminal domain